MSFKLTPRSIARQLAVQGIYCYIINPNLVVDILKFLQDLVPDKIYDKADLQLLTFLLEHGTKQFDLLLSQYNNLSHREIDSINKIEQVILVIAAIELIETKNIDSAIMINEAINLAKIFASDHSYKFINTLTDLLAKKIRK